MKGKIKYWFIGYILFYILGLLYTGIPNVYYLSPIKVFPIMGALVIGNGMYLMFETKYDLVTCKMYMVKYVLISISLIIVSLLVHDIFLEDIIDLSLFIGMPI